MSLDVELHDVQIAEEANNLRVTTGGHSYLLKGIGREQFLEQYRKAYDRVRLNFSPLVTPAMTVEFTPREQTDLFQRIILYWLYVYNVNNRRFRFLWWSMRESQTRRNVLEAAETKLGEGSDAAIALAAHTLRMRLGRFKAWLKRDEAFANR